MSYIPNEEPSLTDEADEESVLLFYTKFTRPFQLIFQSHFFD